MPKETIKLCMKLKEKGMNISELPRAAFLYPNTSIYFIDNGVDIKDFPEPAFDFATTTMKFLNAGIKISKFLSAFAFIDSESTLKLHNLGVDVNRINSQAIENIETTLKFLERGIDIYNLPKEAFVKPEAVYRLIDEGIDITKLYGKDLLWIDFISEYNYTYGNNLYRDEYFKESFCKTENVKYLLELVDNDYTKLNQFPIDFFTCDISLIGTMFEKYNLNIARSIFGLNNPKLIGTLVYCDSVFRNYKKEDYDYDLIDIDPIEIVKSGAVNTYKYRNNIAGMDDNLDSYKKQFIYHDNGDIRMVNGEFNLKANILDKLRNASCHFRFKPVKDSEGNIVEDKIYLYDRDDNGIINFNMIIDIKDLVEIAREVELDLIRKNVRINYNYVEENKYRSR